MYDSTPNTSLYKNIYRQLHGAIVSGRIPAGSRLPSLRQLAKDQEVSRITVATAYRELQLEGLIETRERSGTFVADLPKKSFRLCYTSERTTSRNADLMGTTPATERRSGAGAHAQRNSRGHDHSRYHTLLLGSG